MTEPIGWIVYATLYCFSTQEITGTKVLQEWRQRDWYETERQAKTWKWVLEKGDWFSIQGKKCTFRDVRIEKEKTP